MSSASHRAGFRSKFLGAFIVGQLGFILTANFLPLVRAPKTDSGIPGQEAKLSSKINVLGGLTNSLRHWSNLTGQLQGWSLYAPHVPMQATFVAVELRWDEDDIWPAERVQRLCLRSEIEPVDPAHFYRPFVTFRLLAYEANLGLVMWNWSAESAAKESEVWRQRLAAAVRKGWKPMRAYLQWRQQAYEREHPEMAPARQIILLARMYHIPTPGREFPARPEAVERPLARWRPGTEPAPGFLPIESFNPVTGRFEPITIQE